MKNVIWVLFAVLLTPSVATANVRAPVEADGDIVIAKLAKEASASIVLTHQKLVVTMPELEEKKFSSLQAKIEATYTFENTGELVTVPAVFLATNIHDATVTVNGKSTSAPADAEMNTAQQSELAAAVGQHAPPMRRPDDPVEGKASTFEMALQPGKNTVVFSYTQSVRFSEGGTRYGGPKHDRSSMALTYLLYPCKEWQKAADFSLETVVHMPDYVKPGWFWDTHWAPDLTTNLTMKSSYDKKARLTTWEGTFQAYAQDVLTIEVRRGEKR